MLEFRRYLYNVQAHIHYTEVAHPRFQTSRLKEPPLEVKQECFWRMWRMWPPSSYPGWPPGRTLPPVEQQYKVNMATMFGNTAQQVRYSKPHTTKHINTTVCPTRRHSSNTSNHQTQHNTQQCYHAATKCGTWPTIFLISYSVTMPLFTFFVAGITNS